MCRLLKSNILLDIIIGRVYVCRDEIKVHFKLKISQFIGTMGVEIENQLDADKVIE
ncbi:hypothetical protein ACFP56_08680 [Paenibacillus septentrionalis]|uniref:Uncharacterized protein n=1 Tax=Paenibacillus septentrionalis TaxID=429342 RepID=A0ABW1V4L4_9BACL